MLGILPDTEGSREALVRDLNYHCPRCGKKLEPKPEYHHELYFPLKFIIWKLTHPWRLLK